MGEERRRGEAHSVLGLARGWGNHAKAEKKWEIKGEEREEGLQPNMTHIYRNRDTKKVEARKRRKHSSH